MKSDMKISPWSANFANLNRDCKLSISCRIHAMPNNIQDQREDPGLHIHHTMHNCQYTSFLGFAKLEKKKIDHVIMIITKTNNIKIEKPIMLHRCKMAI
jgi:hypothetical protein